MQFNALCTLRKFDKFGYFGRGRGDGRNRQGQGMTETAYYNVGGTGAWDNTMGLGWMCGDRTTLSHAPDSADLRSLPAASHGSGAAGL